MTVDASARSPWATWALLGLILAGGLGVRLYHLGTPALDVDELFTVHFATGRGAWEDVLPLQTPLSPAPAVQSMSAAAPWWRVWTSMGYDTHPPLHPMLLRAWSAIAGEGDAAQRGLSVLLSLLSVALLFDAVRALHGDAAGLWAAALAAFAGPQVQYAQEIRSYAMVLTLGAAALAIAARIGTGRARGWKMPALLGGVSLAAMLTHYWSAGVLAPAAAFAVLRADRATRRRVIVCLAAAAAVFLAAWGPFLWQQRGNFQKNMLWIADVEPGRLGRSLRWLAALPLRLLFEPGRTFADDVGNGVASPLAYVPAVLYFAAVVLAIRRRREGYWLWAAALLVPIGLVLAADVAQQRKTLSLVRYTLPASLGLFAILATLAAGRRGPTGHVVPAIAILACLIGLPRAYDRGKPNWRELASRSVGTMTEGSDALAILCPPDGHWMGAIIYMALSRYAGPPPGPAVILNAPAAPPVAEALRAGRRVIVVSNSTSPPIREWLGGIGTVVRDDRVPAAGSVQTIEIAK